MKIENWQQAAGSRQQAAGAFMRFKRITKENGSIYTTIISWVRRDESSLKSFDVQISVLPRATFLVSNGNNIVARNFTRFATIDVKPDTSPLETETVARDNN